MKDMVSNIKVVRSISPVAVGTTGTGQTGKIVDRRGFEGVTILISYGTITATAATIIPVIKHGDVTGTMTSVADADLITMAGGVAPELAAAIAATTPRTSGTSKNVSKRIGYIGGKRYVSCNIVSTTTAGPPVSATVILSHPHARPTTG
jgi:hypothetical protein